MRVCDLEVGRLMRRAAQGSLMLLSLSMLTACPFRDKLTASDSSQVVAQVNDDEITIHQVQVAMQMQPGVVAQFGDAAASKVLDSLIEQELAAQAARRAGLDSNPRVLQAMELAKREVLARAYQDQLADKASLPDTQSIDRYYDAHPELFAARRQYTLLETRIQAKPDQAQALMSKAESVGTPEAIRSLVVDSGLPYSSRNTIQWAEGLPMDLLPKLAYLRMGQSVAARTPDGVLILTVLHTDDGPLTRGQAQRAIQVALIGAKRRELVAQGMATLKQNAHIVRQGSLAPTAASAP